MGQPEQRAKGAGPFTTRLTWRLPDGGTAVWESRLARRRGVLAVHPLGAAATRHIRADAVAITRLRRLNAIAAIAFVIGGALFAAGAADAQFGSGDATECASIYFAGGLFFTTGGYASLLQVINARALVIRGADAQRRLTRARVGPSITRGRAGRLRDGNPLGLPRRVDGNGGGLSGAIPLTDG